MATSDLITQVASLTAQVKDWQDKANIATDPTAKAMASMMASNAESQLETALQQLQHSVDSTNTFLDNMSLWSTLGSVANGLGQSIGSVALLFRK